MIYEFKLLSTCPTSLEIFDEISIEKLTENFPRTSEMFLTIFKAKILDVEVSKLSDDGRNEKVNF